MTGDAKILPCGEQALTVELSRSIDEAVNRRVIALARDLEASPPEGLVELVPTYRSLLVRYDPLLTNGAAMTAELQARLAQTGKGESAKGGRLWHLPVFYGGEIGLDLDDLAKDKGLSREELIRIHTEAEYRVYMIGFAPGFAYLGGLPEILHTPRLKQPRADIPAGAIGIGGAQANVNSVIAPSGWRYIGWTPVRIFDEAREEPFLLRSGDLVRFHPVDEAEARERASREAAGETTVEPEALS